MRMSYTVDILKPIEKWSNKDFLLYFSNKLCEFTGKRLIIPNEAWIGFVSQIKIFRNAIKIDNENYKNHIDSVFKEFFTKDKIYPAFGAIVNIKLYKLLKKENIFSNEHFIKLKNEMSENSILFSKF